MTWANQIKILKQQFEALMAVIGSGLVNAIKPFVMWLNKSLEGVIAFARKVVNALGKIFGWEIEISEKGMTMDDSMIDVIDETTNGIDEAADSAGKLADNIEEAKEEEEDLQRTVLGFDELNKMNPVKEDKEEEEGSPDKGAGDGAGKGNGLLPTSGAIDSGDVAVSIKRTKALYESEIDSLFELGQYIGDTLKNALDSIDWNKVYEGARGFGTGLANFLNGLISPGLFASLGRTIGNALNTALHALNAFVYTFDFANLGKSINEGLRALARAIDVNLLKDTLKRLGEGIAETLNALFSPSTAHSIGKLLADGLNAIIDGLEAFADKANWAKYGKTLKEGILGFLNNLDMDNIIETFGKYGDGIATMLNELADPVMWQKIGSTVAGWLSAIMNFFDKFGKKLEWGKWGQSINAGLQSLIDTIDWELMHSMLVTWASGIAAFLNNVITPELGGSIGKAVGRFTNNIVDALGAFAEKLKWKQIGESIATGINTLLETFDWKALGVTINVWALGLLDALRAALDVLNWGALFDGVKETLSAIDFAGVGTAIIDTLWTGLTGSAMPEETKQKVINSFSGLETALGNLANFTFDSLKDLYNDFLVPVGTWVLGTGLPKLADILKHTLEKISWDKLKSGLDGLYQVLAKFTEGIGDGFLMFFDGVANFPGLSGLINTLADGLDNLFGSGLTDQDASKIHDVGEALGFALGAIVTSKLTIGIGTAIKNLASNKALPALLTALTAHPAGTILAAGAALGAALFGLYTNANKPEVAENVKGVAEAIQQIGDELAGTEISADGDYAYISSILDKYLELNNKLIKNGTLEPEEQSLFEWYATQLESYSEGIITKTTNIGDAYLGTRTELEKLLETQRDQIKQKAYEESLNKYYGLLVEQEIILGQLNGSTLEYIKEQAKAALATYNTTQEAYGFGHEVLKLNDVEFDALFAEYIASMQGAGNEAVTSTDLFKKFVDALGGDTRKALADYAISVETANNNLKDTQEKIGIVNQKLGELQSASGTTATTINQDAENVKTYFTENAKGISSTIDHEGKVVIPDLMTGIQNRLRQGGADGISAMADGMTSKKDTVTGAAEDVSKAEMQVFEITVPEASTIGENQMGALSVSIMENKGKPEAAAKEVAETTTKTIVDITVPEATEIGEKTDKAFADGQRAGKPYVSESGKEVVDVFVDEIKGTIPKAEENGKETDKTFADSISSNKDMVTEAASDVGSSAVDSINPRGRSGLGYSPVMHSVRSANEGWRLFITDDIVSTVKNAFGMGGGGSSTVMSQIGTLSVNGFLEGSKNLFPSVQEYFRSIPSSLKSKLGNVVSFFKPSGEETIQGMKDGESSRIGGLEEVFAKLPTQLGSQMSNMESTFKSIGGNVPSYIKTGMQSTTQSLLSAVASLEQSMRGQFTQTVYDSWWTIGYNLAHALSSGLQAVHIPMPHYSVSSIFGGNVGGQSVYVPQVNVSWWKTGGMAYGPSLVGIGEAGNEAILPLENQGVMHEIASAIVSGMIDSGALANAVTRGMVAAGQTNDRPIVVNATLKTENNEVLARAVAKGQKSLDYRMNPVAQY